MELCCASEVFRAAVALTRFGAPRKDAEERGKLRRDGRAPHFNFSFRVECSQVHGEDRGEAKLMPSQLNLALSAFSRFPGLQPLALK